MLNFLNRKMSFWEHAIGVSAVMFILTGSYGLAFLQLFFLYLGSPTQPRGEE